MTVKKNYEFFEMVYAKKGVLKSFTNLTGKRLCRSLFLIKLQGLELCEKGDSHVGVFLSAKFLRTRTSETSANSCF